MTAHSCVHVLKSRTVHTHTHTHTHTCKIPLYHSFPLRAPSAAPPEIWRLPSLINGEAAPINIFISACAPCWKHIQGGFKLYELTSYLLRQLSMPTPSPNFSSPYSSSMLYLLPSFFFPFFLPPLRFLHSAEMGFELLGFTRRATSREDLKFQFRFHHLVLGKFEWTHSQPGDTQYDAKAGSYLITGRVNTEGREEDSPRWLTQRKWSELECCSLYDSLVFTYNTSSCSSCPGGEMPTILLPATLLLSSEKVPKLSESRGTSGFSGIHPESDQEKMSFGRRKPELQVISVRMDEEHLLYITKE